MIKTLLNILFLICTFSLLAAEEKDSVDRMLVNLSPEEKIQIWESWYAQLDPFDPAMWEAKQSEACTDAYQVFSEKEAREWCFYLRLEFAEDLLFHNFHLKSTAVFRSLRKEVDSLTLLNESVESLDARWNIFFGSAQYSKFQEVDSASVYFQNAEEIIKTLDAPKLSYELWKEQGRMWTYAEDSRLALEYFEKIKTLSLDLDPKEKWMLQVLNGRAYTKSGQIEKSGFANQSLANYTQNLDTFSTVFYEISYLEYLCYSKREDSAEGLIQKLIPALDSLKNMPLHRDFSDVACRYYTSLGKYEACRNIYLEHRGAYNRTVVKERKQVINIWEEKLESSKKKTQIINLQQEKSIKRNQFRSQLAGIIATILLGTLILFFYLKRNKNRQKKLAFSIQKNKEITENRDRLFSTFTHDIRTPLTLMMGPIERAISNTTNPKAVQDLQLAQRSGKRLMELFNQILDWNKSEAQAMTYNPQAGALAFTLQNFNWRFLDQAKEKGINFNFEILLKEGQYILDYDKLDKVLSNLVGNAIKFCDKGDVVNFTANWTENKLTLTIKDNGPGISKKDQTKLFDRHYQGDQGKLKGGTGIGLALVKDLIKMMKGEISLQSQERNGTTFIVTIPAVKLVEKVSKQEIQNRESQEKYSLDKDKPILLVIEDEPDLMKFLASSLEDVYHVKVANSSSAGLSIAMTQIPDLIISDWSLPDYDGGWFCRKIRANELTSHIPVLILTAFSSDENLKEVLDSGAIARMNKPFQLTALHSQIQNILNQQKQLQNTWGKKKESDPEVAKQGRKDPFLNKILQTIDINFHQVDFTIEKMASILELSRSQLFRKVKNTTGFSPSQLLSTKRLEAAQKLLKNSKENIADIGIAVGFSDPNYFSNAYKKHFGHSPKQERS